MRTNPSSYSSWNIAPRISNPSTTKLAMIADKPKRSVARLFGLATLSGEGPDRGGLRCFTPC